MYALGQSEFYYDTENKRLSVSDDSGVGITFSGAFGWRDITGAIITRGVGATDPAWTQIGSGPFSAYAFAINDVCWLCYHVPHDLVPNSDVFFHVHWLTDGTETAVVKWQFQYTYAKGFNQSAFDPSGTTVTSQEAASGTAYKHMVTETAAVTISGLSEPDGIIYVKITRVTNGGTDNTDTVFVLTADVHYQSTNLATVGKAPSFYGT